MALAKLYFGDEIRIVELSERTTAELNQKIQDCFGLTSEDVDAFFVNEGQLISIKQSQDLVLGLRLVDGDGPIHIKVIAKGEKSFQPDVASTAPVDVSVHGMASQAIYKFGGVYCPPDQLEALMEVLKLKNKRLVKVGLLPASAVASASDEPDDEDADDQDDDDDEKAEKPGSDEDGFAVVDDEDLPVAEPVDVKPSGTSEVKVDPMENDDAHAPHHGPPHHGPHGMYGPPHGPHGHGPPHGPHGRGPPHGLHGHGPPPHGPHGHGPPHGPHGHGPPLHMLPGPMRKMFVPGPVVEALQEKGISLPPPVLHTVLRMLKVRPKLFVKLGLVRPIGVARRDFHHWNKRIRKGGFAGEAGCGKGKGQRKGRRGKSCGNGKGMKGPGVHGPPPRGPPGHGPGMGMYGPPPHGPPHHGPGMGMHGPPPPHGMHGPPPPHGPGMHAPPRAYYGAGYGGGEY
mmetsp:Transcript_10159/g.18017  ORF Transcript_10159/g.18017 Transcript_10159/m.18017 type:complete len:455 (+) Transcript_10159:49-1413(+)